MQLSPVANSVVCWFAAHCNTIHACPAAVYAEDLKFMPKGSLMPDETGCRFAVGQHQMLPDGVKPVDDKILVAKLRPGQVIDLEAHCIKGRHSPKSPARMQHP